MLIKKDQRLILDIVDRVGGIREDQAKILLQRQFPGYSLKHTIDPLIASRKIQKGEGGLLSQEGRVDANMIKAIDVMLLFETDSREPFFASEFPFTLTFFKLRKMKLWRYDVCTVKKGKETAINSYLRHISEKCRLVIFLISEKEQTKELWIPCEHCFALWRNGKYEFYKSESDYDGF